MAFTSPSIPTKPNANNIMALLRTMSDDKLFQFAQAHKNDPYVFPLTFQESNSRKQLRVAQAGQNPPTSEVVDQNLQEMAPPAPQMAQAMPPQQLPEDSGIGQLPAPNMQGMAEGGIVAFEDGGKVPGYQAGVFTGTEMLPDYLKAAGVTLEEWSKMTPLERGRLEAAARAGAPVAARPSTMMESGIRGINSAGSAVNAGGNAASGVLNKAAGPLAVGAGLSELYYTSPAEIAKLKATENPKAVGANTPNKNLVERLVTNLFSPSNKKEEAFRESPAVYADRKVAELEAANGKKLSAAERNAKIDAFTVEKIESDLKTNKERTTLREIPASSLTPPPAGSADIYGGPPSGAGGALGRPAMPAMPTMGGLPSLGAAPPKLVAPPQLDETRKTADDAKAAANTFFNANEAKTALQTYQDKEATDIATQRTKTEQGLAALPKRYEDYEKRLKAQEKEDAGDKEKLAGASILESALDILSGESPYTAVNLGRGKSGVKSYNEGLKDIKRSARERDKAFGDIENARQAQEEGKFDKMQAFEQSAATRMSAARGRGIDGIIKIAEVSGTTAAGLYNNAENNFFANKRVNVQEAGQTDRTNAQIAGQLQSALIGERGANARAVYGAEAQKFIASLPSGQQKLFADLGDGDVAKGLKAYASIMGPDAKGEWSILKEYTGPKGEMALMLMEQKGPEGQRMAQQIRSKLQAALLTPTDKPAPTGQVLVGQ